MGLTIGQISDGVIEVISKLDSALIYDDETYTKYIETLDESLLSFADGDQPTRFVMRKVLPYQLAQNVQNKQIKLERGEVQYQPGSMADDVRCALIDIKNPPTIPEDQKIKFEKSKNDSGASEALVEKLMAAGIVADLFAARQSYLSKNMKKSNLKKS